MGDRERRVRGLGGMGEVEGGGRGEGVGVSTTRAPTMVSKWNRVSLISRGVELPAPDDDTQRKSSAPNF